MDKNDIESNYNKLKVLSNRLYIAIKYTTEDINKLHKAMEDYHNFIKQVNKNE